MTAELKKAAVIGHPIGHSKSPLIHGTWLETYGINGSYEAIDILPEALKEEVEKLVEQGYAGFNVTIPHKEAIIPLCEVVDDSVKEIGAANTIVVKDGKLYGSNTDAFGFLQNIKETAPDFDFCTGPALVLGAGGASRAIIYALKTAGVPKIIISNRTREKAETLAREFGAEVCDWDKRDNADHMGAINLLVNTTSLGMSGRGPLEMDLSNLSEHALVTDIVYAPLYTDLLTRAEARGNSVVTGIGMLIHQARPGFERWFGTFPEVTKALKEKVLK